MKTHRSLGSRGAAAKDANRRAGAKNPSENPSLGLPAAFSAVGQREVRERWRAGGTGERGSEAARGDGRAGAWRRESGGRLRQAEVSMSRRWWRLARREEEVDAGLAGLNSCPRTLVGWPKLGH